MQALYLAKTASGEWLANGARSGTGNTYVFLNRKDGRVLRSGVYPIDKWTEGPLRIDPAPTWNRDERDAPTPAACAPHSQRQPHPRRPRHDGLPRGTAAAHATAGASTGGGDARTPARSALMALGVNLLLSLAWMGPLGRAGLALATSLAAFLNDGLLMGGLVRPVASPFEHSGNTIDGLRRLTLAEQNVRDFTVG